MKCNKSMYFWQYPKRLVCEGDKIPANIDARNGYGYFATCDGSLKIDLHINHYDDEEISVSFWCNKCGSGNYPEHNLPTDLESLQEWINARI